MTQREECALIRQAMSAGCPPHPLAVLIALAHHTNRRNECHPGLRKIAASANVHRTKVSGFVEFLEHFGVITVRRVSRQLNHYKIQSRNKWTLSPDRCQFYKVNLSPRSDNLAVTPQMTDQKTKLQINCHPTGDVTVKEDESATAEKSVLEDALPRNGHQSVIPFRKVKYG